MLKYLFLNISKTKKLYIPFLIIITLIAYMLMFSFAMRENISMANEKYAGKYAAVAITTENGYFSDPTHSMVHINIDDEFIEKFFISEYISDYYAFTQRPAGSHTLEALTFDFDAFKSDWENVYFNALQNIEGLPFTLMVYSDVEKSTHFRIGDRRISEGRFAENVKECNISAELAKLNGLSVGDNIEIFVYSDSYRADFEIVGIYEDNTEEISNELVLVNPRNTFLGESEYGLSFLISTASSDNISSNQILTAAPSSKDLTPFRDLGYFVVVYYGHDEKGIVSYVDETSDLLPNQFVILDSVESLRAVITILEASESGFSRLLVIICSVSAIFVGFIIFFILKDRTYDIGVFRIKGMSRRKIAVLISAEIFIASVLACVLAWILYITTFIHVAAYSYDTGFESVAYELSNRWQDVIFRNTASGDAFMAAITNFDFSLSLTPFHLFVILLAVIAFSVIIGLIAVLFISRHEPMKTITER